MFWTFIVGWLMVFGHWNLGGVDFCWEWASGKFAASGSSAQIYGAARNILLPEGECRFQYTYPPTFLFFTYLLGLLPYLTAFAVWVVATFVLYGAVIYAIIPRPAAVLAAVAPIGVPATVLYGQNSFLSTALIGLSLIFVNRRPWLSGIFLGLLTYKPQVGVLFPFALLASRNWRALVSATATSVIFGVSAAVAFGYQAWPAFIASLYARNATLSPEAGVELRLQSIYGLLHWAGASAWISWTGHLIVAVCAAVAVCAVWARPVPDSLKAATLCIGSLVVTPYQTVGYDCVLSVAVAFVVKDGLSRGFLPGERIAMLICLASLLTALKGVPICAVVYLVISFLIARRIVAYRRPSADGRRDDATFGSIMVQTC